MNKSQLKPKEVAITVDELKEMGRQLSDYWLVMDVYMQLINALSIMKEDTSPLYKISLYDDLLTNMYNYNQKIMKDIDLIAVCLMDSESREWLD